MPPSDPSPNPEERQVDDQSTRGAPTPGDPMQDLTFTSEAAHEVVDAVRNGFLRELDTLRTGLPAEVWEKIAPAPDAIAAHLEASTGELAAALQSIEKSSDVLLATSRDRASAKEADVIREAFDRGEFDILLKAQLDLNFFFGLATHAALILSSDNPKHVLYARSYRPSRIDNAVDARISEEWTPEASWYRPEYVKKNDTGLDNLIQRFTSEYARHLDEADIFGPVEMSARLQISELPPSLRERRLAIFPVCYNNEAFGAFVMLVDKNIDEAKLRQTMEVISRSTGEALAHYWRVRETSRDF